MLNNKKAKNKTHHLKTKKNNRFPPARTGAVAGNVTKGVSEVGRCNEQTFDRSCVHQTWSPECRYLENTKKTNMTKREEKQLNYCS